MFVYKFKHLYILCKNKKTVEESIANQSLEAARSIAASIDTDAYQQF